MVKRSTIFYGWWVVAALFGVGMLGPMGRYSITAFFPFISDEFGWTRSEIGLAQSTTLWVYSVCVIFVGQMIDRLGSRKTVFIGGVLCLVGWLLLSTVSSLWQLYLYYGFVMAAAVSMTHFVPLQATSRKWFIRRAGLAGGILSCAFAVGTATFSPVLTWMASLISWQTTCLICAFVFSIPVMLLAHFVIRDTPESIGLYPDGDSFLSTSEDSKQAIKKPDWGLKDALKTPQFWLLCTAYSMMGIVLNGLMSHVVMWAVDLGSSSATSGLFLTMLTIPSVLSRLGGGWLGDKYGKKRVIMLSTVLPLLGMLWAWQGVHSANELLVFTVIMGFVYAPSIGLYAPYLGDLFGRANMGAIYGVATMGWGSIGGVGPVVWGILFDMSGSYNAACLVCALCYGIAMIALLLVRPLAAKTKQA